MITISKTPVWKLFISSGGNGPHSETEKSRNVVITLTRGLDANQKQKLFYLFNL